MISPLSPLSFIGENPLVDAFAFSALIHASLGGSLATKPATSIDPTPNHSHPSEQAPHNDSYTPQTHNRTPNAMNAIQPLHPKFARSTLLALLRFVALHPLIVLLTISSHFAFHALNYHAKYSWHIQSAYSELIAWTFFNVGSLLFLSPLCLTFLQTHKSAETVAGIKTSLASTKRFILEQAWGPDTPLNWTLILVVTIPLLIVTSSISYILSLTSSTVDQTAPLLKAWLFSQPIKLLAFSPAFLVCGVGDLLVPSKCYHTLFLKPAKLGTLLLHFYLTPAILDANAATSITTEIPQQNSRKELALLALYWTIARFATTPIGLAPLIDAFAFAALLHASMGGSLNPEKKPATAFTPQIAPTL